MENVSSTYMLTTRDNPYNPFTDFTNWLLFDKEKGYDTSDYLARLSTPSDSFSEDENNKELERAIDDVIETDVLGIYVKVSEENFEKVFQRLKELETGEDEVLSIPDNFGNNNK